MKEGVNNIQGVVANWEDPCIPEPVDVIFSCNTYHHFNDRTKYFSNLKKYFKKEGKNLLAICDWKKEKFERKIGPHESVKMSEEEIISEVVPAGYKHVKIEPMDTPYNYLLIFENVHNKI